MGFKKESCGNVPFRSGFVRGRQSRVRTFFFRQKGKESSSEKSHIGRDHRGRLHTVPIPQHLFSYRKIGNLHTISTSLFTRKEIMPQALSIYQKPPPAAACGTRLELVARYDLGLTLPHNLVTHRFYFLSASIVALVEPCDDGQTPRRPGTRHSMRRHAARKRAREAPR